MQSNILSLHPMQDMGYSKAINPKFEIYGNQVVLFDQQKVDFGRQRKLLHALDAMLSGDGSIPKQDLCKLLYPEYANPLSQRQRRSIEDNTMKAMSRIRATLRQQLPQSLFENYEWISYCTENDSYELCKPKRQLLIQIIHAMAKELAM